MEAEPASAIGPDQFTPRQFQQVATLIQCYSGIKMPPSKKVMIEGRLRKRARARGLANLSEYFSYVFEQNGIVDEEVHLINAATTNKTEFFREREHFRILADELLPGIVAGRRVTGRDPIKIWSAAASIGAEAYTIAMVLAEFERLRPDLASVIFATDICTDVLKIAKLGIYQSEMLTPVAAGLRARYLMRAKDRTSDLLRIVPELRARVRFARLNLMDSVYPIDRELDVVFCRNILIYFEKPTQYAVLTRICGHLRTGGYLILGHSEPLSGLELPVHPLGANVFRKV